MNIYKIDENLYSVGAKDPGRRIFDCLVHMPQGTTYNSYFIKGDKFNALIDCVDPTKIDILLSNLSELQVERIDFIVTLHTEQDHSGAVHSIRARYPAARIVCTAKVRDLMLTHQHVNADELMVVAENDILDLGGMSLKFFEIPFAHWPDNTMALLMPQNILFSSDLYGSHFTERNMVDIVTEPYIEALRGYFSEIMMPFRKIIAKHVAKTIEINPRMIAPSHGPIIPDPGLATGYYNKWTSDDVSPIVTIPFVSMHDSTRTAVHCLADQLKSHGVEVVLHDIVVTPDSLFIETGRLLYDLVDASAIVFAFPTVLGGPHPAIAYSAMASNAMLPKTRFMGMLCSYGWATRAVDVINNLTPLYKCTRFDPVLFKGLPTEDEMNAIRAYADVIADAVLKELK
ncbi:MAG: FprA family A-type flavoprotein [Saccharofermentanales bacterium]